MSKSLKNFISIRVRINIEQLEWAYNQLVIIQEALEKYTARQLRFCFLMQQWDSPLDFKATTMDYIISTEKTFNVSEHCLVVIQLT